jgi:predicted secreted hydrolase
MCDQQGRRQALAKLAGWSAALPTSVFSLSRQALAAAAQPAPVIISANGPPPVDPLRWPQDHGAHLAERTEWWNLKGELDTPDKQVLGFHLAFFRVHVESADDNPSRFAPRHVIAARAALSDPANDVQWHDQRVARIGFGLVDAKSEDMGLSLIDWTLARSGPLSQSVYSARIAADDFLLDLRCVQDQPLMPHGDGNGVIHRDPFLGNPTRYCSQPQLKIDGQVRVNKRQHKVAGRAWMDHGWGKRMMAPDAIGSDWVCINLRDGGALMVMRMRRQDGSTVWEGATLRQYGKPDRIFKHEEIRMTPADTWRSPATGAQYPVSWRIELAGMAYAVKARMRRQEVESGHGTGDFVWEGLCDLQDAQGRVIGSGYLDMSGYASEVNW